MSWNINGLRYKLGDADVQKAINPYDIVVLLKTMKNDEFQITYPGYCCWHFARSLRHKKSKRDSGGSLVLVKERLSKYTYVTRVSEYVVWISIKLGGALKWHAGFVYIPPAGSSLYLNIKECPYDVVQKELISKRATANTIMVGDFNAHTGNMADIPMDFGFNKHPFLVETRVNNQSTNTYWREKNNRSHKE